MCNTFFIRVLTSCFILFSSYRLTAQVPRIWMPDRNLSMNEAIDESLFGHVESYEEGHNYEWELSEDQRNRLLARIKLRQPDAYSGIDQAPDLLLGDPVISAAIIELVRMDFKNETLDESDISINKSSTLALSSEDRATLHFIYGYKLFKQKDFDGCAQHFERAITGNAPEKEYASYYRGIAAIFQKDYAGSIKYLLKVRNEKTLKPFTPYLLAGSHYALKQFEDVVRYYEIQLDDYSFHNRSGLIKLVAFSNYRLGNWSQTIDQLNKLSNLRELSDEESYVLAMAHEKNGQSLPAEKLRMSIASGSSNLKEQALFELAESYIAKSDYENAIKSYDQLLSKEGINVEDILWNQLILSTHSLNKERTLALCYKLVKSQYEEQAFNILLYDLQLSDETIRKAFETFGVNNQLRSKLADHAYSFAMKKIAEKRTEEASFYLQLAQDYNAEKLMETKISMWQGIILYHNNEFVEAQKYLSKGLKNAGKSIDTQLNFEAAYLYAYTLLKTSDTEAALGAFELARSFLSGKSKDESREDISRLEEDIHLRMADCYYSQSNYPDAMSLYKRAYKDGIHQQDYSLFQMSIISDLNQKPYDSVVLLEELINKYPTSRYILRASFQLANTLFSLGQYEKSSRYYSAIINSNSEQNILDESMLQLALIQVNAGNYPKAEMYYQQILEGSSKEQTKKRAGEALKEIYADHAYNPDSYLAISNKINKDKSEDLILFELAEKYYYENKWLEAKAQYNQIIRDYADSAHYIPSLKKLIQILQERNEIPEYRNALLLASESSDRELSISSFQRLSEIYFKEDEFKMYLILHKRLEELYPHESLVSGDRIQSRIARAFTNVRTNAEEIAQLINHPDVSEKHKNKLVSSIFEEYLKTGEYDKLKELYVQTGVKLYLEKHPKFIYLSALTFLNTNQYDQSIDIINSNKDKLINDPAWLAKSILLLSDAYYFKNDIQMAHVALEALIESESPIPPSLKEQAELRLQRLSQTH